MSEQSKGLVRRYYDQVINGRDLDAVGDYFADERTAAGVRKGCFFYFQAFPALHVPLDEFVAEGDRVFLRSTMTATPLWFLAAARIIVGPPMSMFSTASRSVTSGLSIVSRNG